MKFESQYYGVQALGGADTDEITHHGVLGMKWGIRRYQNKDGSLTKAGERHRQKTGEYGYHYHSRLTKRNQRLAEKAKRKAETTDDKDKKERLLAKAKKFEERAKRSDELDRSEEKYARSVNTGKYVASRIFSLGLANRGSKRMQRALAEINKDVMDRSSRRVSSESANAKRLRKAYVKGGAEGYAKALDKRTNRRQMAITALKIGIGDQLYRDYSRTKRDLADIKKRQGRHQGPGYFH